MRAATDELVPQLLRSAVSRQWVQGNELIVTVLAVLVVAVSVLVVRRNHTRLDASADELDRQKEDVADR